MGWLITLGVLTFLAILPLGVRAGYNSSGVTVYLLIGPFRFLLYPGNSKSKKQKGKKEEVKTGSSGEKKQQEESGGSLKDFMPLAKMLLDFLQDLRRKLRVKYLGLKVILAGGDPCDLALNYGRAWAALGNLMPQLERIFVIKKRDLEVECDFTSDETTVLGRVDMTIPLGRLLLLVTVYGVRLLKQYTKIMNQRKGGAKV